MVFGVRLHVWGDRACFTRPEFKMERLTYEVMTPSSARGVLEAIYWRPLFVWVIDRIHVLKPIRTQCIVRNEIDHKISLSAGQRAIANDDPGEMGVDAIAVRQQRSMSFLVDVSYVIEAHFEMCAQGPQEEAVAKHKAIFERRARKGRTFHHPYLGVREFLAAFVLLEPADPLPASSLSPEDRDRDLGLMLLDIDYAAGAEPILFKARLHNGAVAIGDLKAPRR